MSARTTVSLIVSILLLAGLSGCDRQKSAADVRKDTSQAEQTAADKLAKTEHEADQRVASAATDVRHEQRDLAHVDAVEREKVANAAAAGDYKVALARCEGLSSSAQRSCKAQADADYEAAKARAKQQRADADPKP